jgi:hypothetical protein
MPRRDLNCSWPWINCEASATLVEGPATLSTNLSFVYNNHRHRSQWSSFVCMTVSMVYAPRRYLWLTLSSEIVFPILRTCVESLWSKKQCSNVRLKQKAPTTAVRGSKQRKMKTEMGQIFLLLLTARSSRMERKVKLLWQIQSTITCFDNSSLFYGLFFDYILDYRL